MGNEESIGEQPHLVRVRIYIRPPNDKQSNSHGNRGRGSYRNELYSSIVASTAATISEASTVISETVTEASHNLNLEQVSQFVSDTTTAVGNDLSHLATVAAQGIDSVAESVSEALIGHEEETG